MDTRRARAGLARCCRTAVVVLSLVLLSSCTSTVAGAPVPAGDAAGAHGLPLPPDLQRLSGLFATMRGWDYCAMHDLEAASRITGFKPDEIIPYLGLGDCKLTLKAPSGAAEWYFTIDASRVIPSEPSVPITVNGKTLPQVGYGDQESRCGYSYPVEGSGGETGADFGIEVSVEGTSPEEPACDVARDYITALMPRLENPPQRAAALTSPQLSLAAVDPCVVVAEMSRTVAGGAPLTERDASMELDGPFHCRLLWTPTGNGGRLERHLMTAELRVDRGGVAGTASVAGRPAEFRPQSGSCSVRVRASDTEVVGNPGGPPTVEIMELEVPTCEQAQQLSEQAVASVARVSEPAPAPNAQVLGNLDAPPSAQAAGAPFDPCVVPGWDAYPADVRPTTAREPRQAEIREDSPFAVGCTYNAGPLISLVVWGQPSGTFTAEPGARPGARAARFGGKPGLEQRGTNSANNEPSCYSAFQLSSGIAAILTTFPGDPCAVNRAVLEAVASKVS